MKKFTFLSKVASIMLLFSILGSYSATAGESAYSMFLSVGNPTLTSITIAPVCVGSKAKIVLSGMLLSTNGTAYYRVNNGPVQMKSGSSDATGKFSFDTPILSLNENNLIVEITKLKNTVGGLETNFTGKTATIVVTPYPTLTGVTAATVCAGSSTNVILSGLTPNSTGTAFYKVGSQTSSLHGTADINGEFIISSGALTAGANGTIIEITKIVSDSGCETAFTNNNKVTLVVNPLPVVSASSNSPICDGANLNLTASGGVSYSWSGESSFVSADQNPSFAANIGASGNYMVTVTDANGCVNTANTDVLVNPLPTVVITGDQTICQGSSFSLTASGGTSYAWQGAKGSNNGFGTGKYTTSNATISRSVNNLLQYHRLGDYTVTVTDANSCVNSATATVALSPVLTLAVLPVLPPACEGSDFTINSIATITNVTRTNSAPYFSIAAGNSNDIVYSWSGPNGFTSSSANATVSNASAANAGSYTLAISTATGCGKSASTNVSVNAVPTIELVSSASVCVGSDVTFNAVSNGTLLTWLRNGNPVGFGSSFTVSSADLLDAGTYTLRATSTSLCASEASIELTVNELPVVSASSNSPICDGANLELSSDGGVSYAWSGASFSSADQNPSFAANVGASGNYMVTVTDANGCVNTANTDVVVNALPTVVITGDQTICQGSSFSLTASGGTSYAWEGAKGSNNGFGTGKYTSSNATISRSVNNLLQYHRLGDYTVTVTDANSCVNSATATVALSPVLTLAVLPVLPPACEGSDFTINSLATINTVTRTNSAPYFSIAAGNSNDIVYSWSGPNGFTSADANATVSNASAANAGSYTLAISTATGCGKSVSTNVNVNALPTIELVSSASVCVGSDVTFNAVSNGTLLTWLRNGNPVGFGSSFTVSSADLLDAGTYTLRATSTSLCASESSIELTVNELPVVSASSNSPICDGANLELSSDGGVSYAWSGESSFVSADQNPSFAANVGASGNYIVTVTDANGCVNTANTAVLVNPLPTVVITGDQTICQGSSFSLTASGGTSYAWQGAKGSNNGFGTGKYTSSNATISRSVNNLLQYHRLGDYTVTVTDANSCVNSATATVALSPVLTLAVLPVLPPACEGSDFTINSLATINTVTRTNSAPYFSIAAGNSNDIVYSWSGPNGFTSADANATVSNASAANAGSYTLAISTATGCGKSASTNVNVNAVPTIELVATASVCEGSDITLSAVSNGALLTWLRNGNPVGFGSSFTISSADLSDAGAYTLRATSTSLCSSEASIELTVNPLPTMSGIEAAAVCSGGKATVVLTGLLGGTEGTATYTINGGSPSTVTGITTPQGTFSFETPQLTMAANGYVIEIIKLENAGTLCATEFTGKTVTLQVNPKPKLGSISTTAVCSGNSATIVLNGLLAGTLGTATYTINGGSTQYEATGTSTTAGTFSFETDPLPAGANGYVIKIIKIKNVATSCESSFNKTVTLMVNPSPTLFSVDAEEVYAGNKATIVLSGLLPETLGTATYRIGNALTEYEATGLSNTMGEYSFTTQNLGLAQNNLVIRIIKIVNVGTSCETIFNESVTLKVIAAPSATATPSTGTSDVVLLNPTSNIEMEEMAKVAFVLYPNPVNDVLNIETTLDIKSVEFLNISGQKVLSSNQKQINVSHLPSGTYMVRIQDAANNVVIKKIVIQ